VVGGRNHGLLGAVFAEAEATLEQALARITLERLLGALERGAEREEAAGVQDGEVA